MNYMISADSRVDIYKKFNVNSLLEIMFLAVLPEYGKKSIGLNLCKESIEVARNQNLKLVTALFTSHKSQSIGEKLGFDVLFEESFDNYFFNGMTFAERNKDCTLSSKLVAISLEV